MKKQTRFPHILKKLNKKSKSIKLLMMLPKDCYWGEIPLLEARVNKFEDIKEIIDDLKRKLEQLLAEFPKPLCHDMLYGDLSEEYDTVAINVWLKKFEETFKK